MGNSERKVLLVLEQWSTPDNFYFGATTLGESIPWDSEKLKATNRSSYLETINCKSGA